MQKQQKKVTPTTQIIVLPHDTHQLWSRGNNIKIHSETVVVDNDILNAGSHHGSTFYEHKKFIKAIQNNSEAEVSLDDGLKAVAIGQAAELSIIEKRVILLSELL